MEVYSKVPQLTDGLLQCVAELSHLGILELLHHVGYVKSLPLHFWTHQEIATR